MESLYFLVPCALIFIGLAIKVLFWAINNGQYDNLDTEAHRILFDAEKTKKDLAKTSATLGDSPATNTDQSTNDSNPDDKTSRP
ncbi:MAG TPA: cbb3-type cytochrome oxidase assembly protein CcoS [Cellvibrio sp.]|nr:cbb3-type cytochrome oxidase assembly protein CcoS [Cellvibrio sp.]